MYATNMEEVAVDRKGWDSDGETTNDLAPRNPPSGICAHSMGMHALQPATAIPCNVLRWAASQDHLPFALQGFLLRLVRISGGETLALSQAAIGELVGLKDRQVRAHVNALVRAGVVVRMRRGGAGQGRAADELSFSIPATGRELPEAAQATGNSLPGATGDKLPEAVATGNEVRDKSLPVGATGNAPPIPPYKTTLRDSSPNTELELTGGVGETPAPAPRKRRAKPKSGPFVASPDTLPVDPPEAWTEAAADAGMVNGTVDFEWKQFRRWHIEAGTEFKRFGGSISTWVRNWRTGGAKQAHSLTGGWKVDADGRRYKNARHNPI